ncbi:hypothetical protein TNCV_504981 [Trichonephila clavipes]|nr:hypothetical protein TNCV_504981 [Trichonephila clavipes]
MATDWDANIIFPKKAIGTKQSMRLNETSSSRMSFSFFFLTLLSKDAKNNSWGEFGRIIHSTCCMKKEENQCTETTRSIPIGKVVGEHLSRKWGSCS